MLNIIEANFYVNNFLSAAKFGGLERFDHWLYGRCNKDIFTNEIKDLITYEFFNVSACIIKFYNSTTNQYYNIGHPKFTWPSIAHELIMKKIKYMAYMFKNAIIKQ